jgi:hypothetical protein
MLHEEDDLWLTEELSIDEPSELLRAMPELRQYVRADHPDDDFGLRSILEHPEALSKAWWRHGSGRKRHASHAKRHPHVLRAA